MARGDWNTVSGTTNNNNYFFTGIRWRYRDDLFGTSGYPTDRISSNTDIIEYQPFVGKKNSSVTSRYYNNWLTSYYKYSYNTTSGSDPADASNKLDISTTFRFDQASTNSTYYLTKGSGLSSATVMNTSSSTTSRIIQVPHCSDGTSKVRLYFYFAGNSATAFTKAETNAIITLDNIPRYTSITSFTVAKRNETSLTFNWSTADTVDYVYYSTDNGSNWTGYDVTDGTSGSFNVSGLSPNTTYNCKLRVRRKDSQLTTDSSTVSQTTYKVPTQGFSSKTETSITMTWSCDTTADYIWYSKDNGSNWTAVGSVSSTSGSYTISGLSANTSYNIKTRVRRSATQTTYDTTNSPQTTYDYPKPNSITDFVIGNGAMVDLYNPLGRNVTLQILQKNTDTVLGTYTGTYNGVINAEFKTTDAINRQYASIPNSPSGTYYAKVTYSGVTKTLGDKTYSIVGNETPTFNNFTYKDNNSTVSGVTGNDQVMVKGLSTVKVTVSSANKMVANKSANPSSYTASMSNLSGSASYSSSDVNITLGTINASGTQRLSVTAYDSRGLYKTIYKDITVYDYSKPVINATVKRLNDFENETTLKVSGTYTKLTINNVNKNSITSVQYRYRESGGTWSSWTNLSTTVNNGNFTCSDVILSLDNTKSFEFEIKAVDTLQQTTTKSLGVDIGQAIFFISTNNKACYINGQEIIMYDVVDTW